MGGDCVKLRLIAKITNNIRIIINAMHNEPQWTQ